MEISEGRAGASPILQALQVKRAFGWGAGTVYALKKATLHIPAQKFVALIGPSGSGKTTLMNLLGALDLPTEGRVFFDGQEISKLREKERNEIRRTKIGFVFQSYALIPYMSAYENVDYGMRIAGFSAKTREELTHWALEIVGMKGRMNHRPSELSGGEQQRVAIARAIAHRPKLLLADEPTAELDSRTGLQVIKVFKELVSKEGLSIVITTHDPAVMEIVDQVYVLEDGEIVE